MKKNLILKNSAKYGGYSLFFLTALFICTYISFPTESLRVFLENTLSRQDIRVKINELHLSGLSGIMAHNLEIIGVPSSKDLSSELPVSPLAPADHDQKKPAENKILIIDEIKASLNLWDAVFKKGLSIRLDAELLGGRISKAVLQKYDDGIKINIPKIEKISLNEKPLQIKDYKIKGVVEGNVLLDFNQKGLNYSTGNLELKITDACLIDPIIKSNQFGDFKLADIELGDIDLNIVLDKKSNIQEFENDRVASKDLSFIYIKNAEISGTDLDLQVLNRSTIRPLAGRPFSHSILNLEFAFRLKENFFENTKDEITNKPVKTFLNSDIRWKRAEKNGYYGIKCSGTLNNPQCNPTKPNIRGGFKPKIDTPVSKSSKEEQKGTRTISSGTKTEKNTDFSANKERGQNERSSTQSGWGMVNKKPLFPEESAVKAAASSVSLDREKINDRLSKTISKPVDKRLISHEAKKDDEAKNDDEQEKETVKKTKSGEEDEEAEENESEDNKKLKKKKTNSDEEDEEEE